MSYLIQQKAFYVSTTGDDSTGNGTIGNPWKTLDKFLSTAGINGATSGSTCYMRGGTYTLTSTGTYSNLSNITIAAYPGETPIISGGTVLSSWVRDSTKAWYKTGCSTTTRNMWCVGRSPWPGSGTRRLNIAQSGAAFANSHTVTNTGFNWSGANNPLMAYNSGSGLTRPQDVEVVCASSFACSHFKGASINSTDLTMQQPDWGYARTLSLTNVETYWQNAYELMGNAGEFYLNQGTNEMYAMPHGSHGTFTGSPTWTADAPSVLSGYSTCLAFAGATTYVTTTTPGPLGVGAKSISFWIKNYTNTGSSQRVMRWGSNNTGTDTGVELYINAAGTAFGPIGSHLGQMAYNLTTALTDGNWHHLAVVMPYNTPMSQWRVYQDGTLLTSVNLQKESDGAPNGPVLTSSLNVTWGLSLDGTKGVTASISDPRIYDSELTQAQITSLNAGTNVTTNLLNWWKFTENTGTTTFDTALEDFSSDSTIVGNLTTLLDFTNCSVKLCNLTFAYTTWPRVMTNGLINAFGQQYKIDTTTYDWFPQAIQFHGSSNVAIVGCKIQNLGTSALLFNNNFSNISVENNLISDVSGSCLDIGNMDTANIANNNAISGVLVYNNAFLNCGREYQSSIPFWFLYRIQNYVISRNEFGGGHYSGTELQGRYGGGGTSNVSINGRFLSNFLHDFQQSLISTVISDGATIYFEGWHSSTYDLVGQKTTGLIIAGNLLCNSNGVGGVQQQIYDDTDTTGVTVTGNIIDGTAVGTYFDHSDVSPNFKQAYISFTGNILENSAVSTQFTTTNLQQATYNPNTLSATNWPNMALHVGPTADATSNKLFSTDTFPDSNGTDLSTVRGWTMATLGTFQVQSATVQLSTEQGIILRNFGNASQTINIPITINSFGQLPTIWLCWQDQNNNTYMQVTDSGHVVVNQVVAGVTTQKMSVAYTFSTQTTYTFKIRQIGRRIRLWINGVFVGVESGFLTIITTNPATWVGFGRVA